MPSEIAPVLPFSGVFHHWTSSHPIQVLGVTVPALLFAALAVVAWLRGVRSPEVTVLLANVVLFVVVLNPTSYVDIYGSARMAIGVPLFALLSLPSLLSSVRVATWSILAASAGLWGLAFVLTVL
jgi:hypothetical protein